MTLDESFEAAARLIEQRGQLLNGHLLRLVEGNKELFRQVRERLILERVAEDRSGVGLARIESPNHVVSEGGQAAERESIGNDRLTLRTASGSNQQTSMTETNWWLMTSGKVCGPFDFATMYQMRRLGEIKSSDVVRYGAQGDWRQPDEIPELTVARIEECHRTGSVEPLRMSGSRSVAVSKLSPTASGFSEANRAVDKSEDQEQSKQNEHFLPPDKTWSMGNQVRRGLVRTGWKLAADIVGGSRRLVWILTTIALLGLFWYWWEQPPVNQKIYNEFSTCRAALIRLRERRAPRSEWAPVIEQYRPRIQGIVDRLKKRATDSYPTERSLYLAGSLGLLPMLENPIDPTVPERVFDDHMRSARESLDSRSNPQSSVRKLR